MPATPDPSDTTGSELLAIEPATIVSDNITTNPRIGSAALEKNETASESSKSLGKATAQATTVLSPDPLSLGKATAQAATVLSPDPLSLVQHQHPHPLVATNKETAIVPATAALASAAAINEETAIVPATAALAACSLHADDTAWHGELTRALALNPTCTSD